MGYPLQVYDVSDQIYSLLLASRYQNPYVYSPSAAERDEPDIWEILLNDIDNLAERQRRAQNIVRPWRIVPPAHAVSKNVSKEVGDASKRLAAVAHEGLSYISMFDDSRIVLSDSFILGRRYAEIEYQETWISLDGTPEKLWYLPTRLIDVDRRRFRWVPVWSTGTPRKKLRTDLHMFDTNALDWVRVDEDYRRRLIEDVWCSTEDRVGHARGVIQAMFFAHYFKTGSIQKAFEGIDRVANGFLLGKLDSLRASSVDQDNATLITNMKDMLNKMRSQHVGVINETDDVVPLDFKTDGLDFSLAFADRFTVSVARLLNGSARPAGHSVDGTGAKAAAEEEGDTSEAFYQFPRSHMDEVLTRDLIGGFCYYNKHNLKEIGLEQAKMPRFSSEQVKRENPIERVEVLNQSRVPILTSEYYEAIDATPPSEDDEVVEPAGMGMGEEGFNAMADKEVDSKTGFPKTSGEARKAEKDIAKAKKPAKMEDEDSVARFDAIERRFDSLTALLSAGRSRETHLHVPETLKVPVPIVNVPAPIVNVAPAQIMIPSPIVNMPQQAPAVAHFTAGPTFVNVPQQPPAVAHFTSGPTTVNMDTSVFARIATALEGFFAWFVGRKRERTITVSRSQDGSLKGESKEEE